jgi:dihydrofolate reductase
MLKTDGVILHCSISLDGFAADLNDRLDVLSGDWGPNPLADEVMSNVGCILGGRRGYDISRNWEQEPEAYGGAVKVPEYVVTRRPPPDDPKTMFADGNDLPATVAKAKTAAKGKMVVIIGPTLGSALLRAGLVDQVVIHMVPVLIGVGRPLYTPDGEPPVRLVKQAMIEAGQVTNFIFRPMRD